MSSSPAITSHTGTDHTSSRRDRPRRRRTGLLGAVVAAVAAIGLAAPAAAAQPRMSTEQIDEEVRMSADEFPCGVDVTFREVGTVRWKAFEGPDGTLVRLLGHIRVTVTATTAYGEVVNRWGGTGIVDPGQGTVVEAGNGDNLHGGAGGVIVNGSGRTIVEEATGEVLFAAGPLETIDESWDEICAVLAP